MKSALGPGEESSESNRMAVRANLALFDREGTAKLVERSPHLRHDSNRELYTKLVLRVITAAKSFSDAPNVLDIGAGDGSATLPFLELGARVTAVDLSRSQLEALEARCSPFRERLQVRQAEIGKFLEVTNDRYDIVVMNSFLHHVPDYLNVIRQATVVLKPRGQLFSFQDPLLYATMDRGALFFSGLAYFCWRAFQGAYKQGLKTRLRRVRGIYIPGSKEDDAEFHVTRNGVDQTRIASCLKALGFTYEIIRYFSTQSGMFQTIGEFMRIENTFGVIAQKTV